MRKYVYDGTLPVVLLHRADQRYYASAYGRFNTADQYVATAKGANDPSTPGSWNKYAYVLGDPVNGYDPTGMFYVAPEGPPTSGGMAPCDLNPQTCIPFGSGYGGVAQRGGGAPVLQTFAVARSAFQSAAKTIATTKFSAKCAGDFSAVGTTANTVTAAAANVNILDGVGSAVSMGSLYATSPLPQLAALSGSMTGTIGQFIASNPGTVAVSQLGGNNVYINAGLIDPTNYYQDIGTMLHELLHNVTGVTDSDLQSDLGLSQNQPSDNITQKLIKDCF